MQRNGTLKSLNIKWQNVGDEALSSIADSLKVVLFVAVILSPVQTNRTLTSLEIYGNDMTSSSARIFAEALKVGGQRLSRLNMHVQVNNTLRVLYYCGSSSVDFDSCMIDALRVNHTLVSVGDWIEYDETREPDCFLLVH